MLEQTSGVSSPQPNKENFPISTCPQLFFELQPNIMLISNLQIFICGDF